MKLGIILQAKESEKAWNAFRFANAALKKQHKVKFFLMGEAVECESITHPQHNVFKQKTTFIDQGGELLACGACLKSRELEGSTQCPVSTMNDCVELVEWAYKTVTL